MICARKIFFLNFVGARARLYYCPLRLCTRDQRRPPTNPTTKPHPQQHSHYVFFHNDEHIKTDIMKKPIIIHRMNKIWICMISVSDSSQLQYQNVTVHRCSGHKKKYSAGFAIYRQPMVIGDRMSICCRPTHCRDVFSIIMHQIQFGGQAEELIGPQTHSWT